MSTAQGSDTSFVLRPGERFTALTGDVYVTGFEGVVVMRPTWEVRSMEGGRRFHAGDTLVVLDYVGEGFYNVWFDGELYQPEAFWSRGPWHEASSADGYSFGAQGTEWWTEVRDAEGQTGWFRHGPDVRVSGNDTCG